MKELVYHRPFLSALEVASDDDAFIDGGYRGSLPQHADRVFRLTHALRHELGLQPGDRFAVMATNSHQYLELYHAAFLGGGVVNPLNLRLAGAELDYIVGNSGTKVAFVDQFFAEHFQRALADGESGADVRTVLIGDGDVPHDLRYEELLEAAENPVPDEPDEDDPVVLMYTGGTTGLPKGVLLDQRAEMLNLYHIIMTFGRDEDCVFLHQTPMFHAASMGGMLGIPIDGATSVFIPLFDPAGVLDLCEQHGVTRTVMVPTMINMVLNHESFRPERLATMRELVYGASPMPRATVDRLIELYPDIDLYQAYGMTEASAVLTFLTPDDHRRGGDVLGSAGRPAVGVQLSVRDANGDAVPTGESGEVCARAGNLMRGYWQNPEATADALRDGWYHTGDAGYLDDHGYLFLVDRVKDMIVTGGENVYSAEVESAIGSNPDVDQVAVIGIPSEQWGEQVHAIVVLRAGASLSVDEVRAWAKARIAGFKVPKSVEFRDEPLPLSGALKVLKRELRKPYWEGQDRAVG